MKQLVNAETANLSPATRRLWGVTLHKEKRSLKEDSIGLADWGEPFENVTHSFYSVRVKLLGKTRHIGVRRLPKKAAELYDSALFHLWGFMKKPKARFNYLRPDEPAPAMLPEVRELREKLRHECSKSGTDFQALNYTFSERNDA